MWSQINIINENSLHPVEKVSSVDKKHISVAGQYKKSNGDSLYYKRIYPAESFNLKRKSRSHVIILHEATTHHKLNDSFSSYLIDKNPDDYIVSLPDLRGHGLSTGVRGHLSSFDQFAFDIIDFLKSTEELSEEKPIVIATGFSALLVLKLYQIYNFPVGKYVSGTVLINPLLGISPRFPEKLMSLTNSFREVFSPIRMPYQFKGNLFSRDVGWITSYNSDPLVNNRLTFGFLSETLSQAEQLMNTSYFIDVPTLALSSDHGDFVDQNKFKLFLKGIDKQFLTASNFSGHAHDLLNDLYRDRVFNDIYNWMMTYKRI